MAPVFTERSSIERALTIENENKNIFFSERALIGWLSVACRVIGFRSALAIIFTAPRNTR